MVVFGARSMWKSIFKKDDTTKDVVMEEITGYGPILLRSHINNCTRTCWDIDMYQT